MECLREKKGKNNHQAGKVSPCHNWSPPCLFIILISRHIALANIHPLVMVVLMWVQPGFVPSKHFTLIFSNTIHHPSPHDNQQKISSPSVKPVSFVKSNTKLLICSLPFASMTVTTSKPPLSCLADTVSELKHTSTKHNYVCCCPR